MTEYLQIKSKLKSEIINVKNVHAGIKSEGTIDT